jgi:hypothetical protein
MAAALVLWGQLVEVGPKPAFRLLERDAAPCRIFFHQDAADSGDTEKKAVAVAEL